MKKRSVKSETIVFSYLLLVILILYPAVISAQTDCMHDPLFIVGGRVNRGFIIQHTKKLKDEVTQSNPWSLEAEAIWHLRKRGVWDYCFCYPRTGIALNYTNFDLPDVLGSAISAYPFIEPFIRAEKPLNFSFRFGMGPSYLTKVYDSITNPDNLFFSARISFFLAARFSIHYRFTDHLSIRLDGSFNHISNSGYKEPNLGCNFPSVNLGVDYSLNRMIFEDREKDRDVVLNPKKNRVDLAFGMSAKPTAHGKDTRYPVFVVYTSYSRVVGRILAVTAGAEWVNDRSVRQVIRDDDRRDSSGNYIDHNRVGALLGVDWLFGRFIFYQQFGYYLYAPQKAKTTLYQRYGLNFKLTDYLYTGLNIKAHSQDADFMDLRFGVYF